MCGFVGYVEDGEKDRKIIKSMSDTIKHRGPDDEGFYEDDKISLAFRRLSIIDLSNGHQPMFNEDSSMVILFNGEIYNYQELKEDLMAKGHVFANNSDTETILHGYEEYGQEITKKLRGMFAFVIWDIKNKVLFGARDNFGIKPFYYYNRDGMFIFGSEIKSFLPHPKFKKELNEEALKTYLTFQYSALDETFFKGVYRLKPGHQFTYKDGKLEVTEYNTFNFIEEKKNFEETVNSIHETITSSIDYHRIADVEVGSFLSSGVDSSYVVSYAKPDKTYTVGFNYDNFDETVYAKDLSKILEIKNTSKIISDEEFFDSLEDVQYYSDEPHANLSAVPLYHLSRLAAKDVKVVLSGEGADELFGGYQTYHRTKFYNAYEKLPLSFRAKMKKFAEKLPNIKGKNFLISEGTPIEDSYIGQAFIFDDEQAIDRILKFIEIDGTTDEKIAKLKELGIKEEMFVEGLAELEQVVKYIRVFGVPDTHFKIDLTIARGLDYYTGTVYETFLNDYKEIGSVCSGGRYENLAGYYTDQKLPGVGISIGLTRLFYKLNELQLIKSDKYSMSDILIIPMLEDMTVAIQLASNLRKEGINTEVYLNDKKLKAKLKYADKLKIPYVVVIGEDEINTNTVKIKNMNTGDETSVELDAKKICEII